MGEAGQVNSVVTMQSNHGGAGMFGEYVSKHLMLREVKGHSPVFLL